MTTDSRRALRRAPLLALLILALALFAAACGGDNDDPSGDSGSSSSSSSSDDDTGGGGSSDATGRFCDDGTSADEVAERADAFDDAPSDELDPARTYTVAMKTSKGDFDIVLDPEAGPLAAANFAYLVENCFYDGIKFHRILDGFVVQAGDPLGTGTGGPGYEIEDDPVEGTYDRGVVAMANAGPDTGGSQFFVITGDDVQLPPSYAIFGKVDEDGMKTVDEITKTPVEAGPNGEPSQPTEDVIIETARLTES